MRIHRPLGLSIEHSSLAARPFEIRLYAYHETSSENKRSATYSFWRVHSAECLFFLTLIQRTRALPFHASVICVAITGETSAMREARFPLSTVAAWDVVPHLGFVPRAKTKKRHVRETRAYLSSVVHSSAVLSKSLMAVVLDTHSTKSSSMLVPFMATLPHELPLDRSSSFPAGCSTSIPEPTTNKEKAACKSFGGRGFERRLIVIRRVQ